MEKYAVDTESSVKTFSPLVSFDVGSLFNYMFHDEALDIISRDSIYQYISSFSVNILLRIHILLTTNNVIDKAVGSPLSFGTATKKPCVWLG